MSADAPAVRVVSRRELDDPDLYRQWQDPGSLARPSALKRKALQLNPFSNPDDPAQIIGLMGARVVGRVDIFPGEISVLGRRSRIIYGSHLFVEEASRHTGVGLLLFLKMQSLHHTTGVCGVSQMIYPLYQKLRWTDFPIPRMVLMRRSRPVIETMIKNRALAGGASLVVDGICSLHRACLKVLAVLGRRDLSPHSEPEMPREVEGMLCAPPERIAPVHSPAWYEWLLSNRFDDAPSRRNGLWTLRNAAGEVIAYFLVKQRFYESVTERQLRRITLGSVQDWAVLRPGAIDERTLVLLAVESLFTEGADAVEVAMPDPSVAAALKRVGFVRAGTLNFLFRAGPGSPLADRRLHDPKRWIIRPADGDNFFS